MRLIGLIAIFLMCFTAQSLNAQDFLSWKMNDRYFSLQVGTGTATYFGDLKHNPYLRNELSNFNIGLEARLFSKISARLQINKFNLKGTDASAADSSYYQQRNLSFYSDNWNFNLQGVFYLLRYKGDYYKRAQMEPYLTAGIGMTTLDPKADAYGESFRLSVLETEGEKYSLTTLSIPLGAGLKFKINEFMNFNLEASYNLTFSDYIDDVSGSFQTSYPDKTTELLANRKDEIAIVNQEAYDALVGGQERGNSSNNDSYLLLKVQLEFYIPSSIRGAFKK